MSVWEQAVPEDYPVVAYLVIHSSLPIFKRANRHKIDEPEAPHTAEMFEDVQAAAQDEAAVATDKRVDYELRLPYTEKMLQRRWESGTDVPKWFEQ